MAVTAIASNHVKYQLAIGAINFSSDVFKIILMNTAFAFDPDAHATLADVTTSQIATGGGYTQDDKVLAGGSLTEDDVNDKAAMVWDDVTWAGTGVGIAAAGAVIIYDDTSVDDTVVGCIDFDADYTTPSGANLQVRNIAVGIS